MGALRRKVHRSLGDIFSKACVLKNDKEKTKAMRPLYQKLRMCDEVLKTEPAIRVNAINLVQQRVYEEQKRQFRKELAKTKPTNTRVR